MYIIYWTVYYGQKMPRNYIGSTTLKRHQAGYLGSVTSVKYKEIWNREIRENPHLFRCHIVEYAGDCRKLALEKEEYWQRKYSVVTNPLFINMSYARKGFVGSVYNRSPESYSKMVETWHRKSPEQKSEIIAKRKSTMMSNPNNYPYGQERREKARQTHLNKSNIEKKQSIQKQLITKSSKTSEEKLETRRKSSEASKRVHLAMTPEQKSQRSERIRKANQNRNPEVNQKIADTLKTVMANRTPEEWAEITEKKRRAWKARREAGIKRNPAPKLLCRCGQLIGSSNYKRHSLKCELKAD